MRFKKFVMDEIEVGQVQTEAGRKVGLTIPGDDESETVQLQMDPEQTRRIAFAIMDVADDIAPPEWRKS